MQAFMQVLVTYKNEEDRIKNEGAKVATAFLPYMYAIVIPDTQGQLTPQSQMRVG